jgi:rhodanese-related sulfurtransferase
MSDTSAYAGDLDPTAAFELLASNKDAVLVDVRTRPEWSFVGVPDLQALGKETLFLEWQVFPAMQVDPGFVDTLTATLSRRGVPADAPLLFLCRSGVRSKAAASVLTAGGRSACFNVSDGFEGPRDDDGHRGHVAGWKAAGLPWVQS